MRGYLTWLIHVHVLVTQLLNIEASPTIMMVMMMS